MEEKDQGVLVREAISERTALALYFHVVDAMATAVLGDSEVVPADGLDEFENTIYLLRKGYGI